MTAAEQLMADRSIPLGPVRVCFTVDEEIGRGIQGLDLKKLGGVCGYTLDSGGAGRIDGETFSADGATITVQGVNTHPSVGKGVMVNAVRILSQFLSRLPTAICRRKPPTDVKGSFTRITSKGAWLRPAPVDSARLRDARLKEYADLLEQIAADLRREHPRGHPR